MRRLLQYAKSILRFRGVSSKHDSEMAFWRQTFLEWKGDPHNKHYEYFYTSYFGLDAKEYEGKSLLDIGCGPCGSLEWADQAEERVGLDPLVERYREFGIDAHKMKYVCAPSEQIPFPDEHFDFVCSFNSLDHVDNLEGTLSEISRVVKKGGNFLLITEINHPPTACEPHTLTEELLDQLASKFAAVFVKLTAMRADHDLYASLFEGKDYDSGHKGKPGILSARLVRKPSSSTRNWPDTERPIKS